MKKTLTHHKSCITRREFIGTVASTAAFTIVPRHVLGGTGYAAPSETLNLALVGAGGHGAFLINEVVSYSKGLAGQLGGVNVVAVCDVDDRRARETISHNHPAITDTNDAGFKRFPQARRYNDFRKLFEWEEKNIDAAVVATPDHTHTGATQESFDSIVQADAVPYVSSLYDEPLRPQFHFSQKVGWNNDPNGMCYANGEYHLFFQHNPFGWKWGNMTWGHAVSKDLVHWTQLENALVFDKLGTMFSGTGAVDKDNTAGFKTGDKDVIVLAYTYAGRFGYPPCPYTQAIAYSNDNGRTFVKHLGNPVVPNISGGSDRDPKVLWHEPTKKWVMVLYLANGKRFGFFTSDDLKEWEQVSEMGGFHECPELFELPVDGDENNTRWVIFGADAQYFIGSFDGKEFTPDHEKKHRVHYGQYYASQTFNQTPDGRRIQIGWARIAMPGMPFNQTFTVPTRLTLRTTDDGIRMFATPVKEIEQLRKPNPRSVTNTELTAESPGVTFDVADQLFDIEAVARRGTAARVVLRFGENVATYDFNAQKLDGMPLKMKDGKVTFRVLVDRPMYELVGGNGACYKTSARRDMGQLIGEISLTAEGGSLVVESFDVHEMQSIWE